MVDSSILFTDGDMMESSVLDRNGLRPSVTILR